MLAIAALVVAVLFIGKYFIEKKKQKEEKKDFVLIATGLLVLWLFPGLISLVVFIAVVLLMIFAGC